MDPLCYTVVSSSKDLMPTTLVAVHDENCVTFTCLPSRKVFSFVGKGQRIAAMQLLSSHQEIEAWTVWVLWEDFHWVVLKLERGETTVALEGKSLQAEEAQETKRVVTKTSGPTIVSDIKCEGDVHNLIFSPIPTVIEVLKIREVANKTLLHFENCDQTIFAVRLPGCTLEDHLPEIHCLRWMINEKDFLGNSLAVVTYSVPVLPGDVPSTHMTTMMLSEPTLKARIGSATEGPWSIENIFSPASSSLNVVEVGGEDYVVIVISSKGGAGSEQVAFYNSRGLAANYVLRGDRGSNAVACWAVTVSSNAFVPLPTDAASQGVLCVLVQVLLSGGDIALITGELRQETIGATRKAARHYLNLDGQYLHPPWHDVNEPMWTVVASDGSASIHAISSPSFCGSVVDAGDGISCYFSFTSAKVEQIRLQTLPTPHLRLWMGKKYALSRSGALFCLRENKIKAFQGLAQGAGFHCLSPQILNIKLFSVVTLGTDTFLLVVRNNMTLETLDAEVGQTLGSLPLPSCPHLPSNWTTKGELFAFTPVQLEQLMNVSQDNYGNHSTLFALSCMNSAGGAAIILFSLIFVKDIHGILEEHNNSRFLVSYIVHRICRMNSESVPFFSRVDSKDKDLLPLLSSRVEVPPSAQWLLLSVRGKIVSLEIQIRDRHELFDFNELQPHYSIVAKDGLIELLDFASLIAVSTSFASNETSSDTASYKYLQSRFSSAVSFGVCTVKTSLKAALSCLIGFAGGEVILCHVQRSEMPNASDPLACPQSSSRCIVHLRTFSRPSAPFVQLSLVFVEPKLIHLVGKRPEGKGFAYQLDLEEVSKDQNCAVPYGGSRVQVVSADKAQLLPWLRPL